MDIQSKNRGWSKLDFGLFGLALVGFGMVTALSVFVFKPEFEGWGNRGVEESLEIRLTQTTSSTPELILEGNVESQVWKKLILFQPLLGDRPAQAWYDLSRREPESVSVESWPQVGFYVNYDKQVLGVHRVAGMDPYEIEDVDIEFLFDFNKSVGEFGLVCRLQPNHTDMYVLMVSDWEWRLVRTLEGNETILAQGMTTEEFRNQRSGYFWLQCEEDRLTVWNEAGLKAIVEDNSLEKGAPGMLLTISDDQRSYIYISTEYIAYLDDDQKDGWVGDTIRADGLYATITEPLRVINPESEGNKLATARVKLQNRGFEPIFLRSDQIYLELGGGEVSVLDIDMSGAQEFPVGRLHSLDYPYKLESNQLVYSDLVFDISDVEEYGGEALLVIDLSDQGFAPIQFDLSW